MIQQYVTEDDSAGLMRHDMREFKLDLELGS